MLLNLNQDRLKNSIDEHLYIAEVVDNYDPEELCRVRVRIPEIYGDIPDEHCPWAVQFRAVSLGAAEDQSAFHIPRVGSKVGVIHHRGDVYSPMYMFQPYDGGSRIDEALDGYPNSYGFRDSDGNQLSVDMNSDTAELGFSGDVSLTVNSGNRDGDVSIRTEGSQFLKSGDDSVVDTDGNLILQSSGNILLSSKQGLLIRSPFVRVSGPLLVAGPVGFGGPVAIGNVPSDKDSISFDDSLVRYQELKAYLNDLRGKVNDLISKYNVHTHGSPLPSTPVPTLSSRTTRGSVSEFDSAWDRESKEGIKKVKR